MRLVSDEVVGTGLLEELADRLIGVERHQTVGGDVLDRVERQGAPGAGGLVLGHLRGQVHVRERVAV